MPPLYYPQQPPPIASSNLSPQGKKKKTTNEGGGLGAKWTVEEDRRLVESWTNVSTNPITRVDYKKSGFLNKGGNSVQPVHFKRGNKKNR